MSGLQRMLEDIEMEVNQTRHLIGKDALDDRVMTAIKQVPRHKFLPADFRFFAYDNGPAPIGSGQTISQPYIVALMTDLLNTKPTDTILEIGTGSGYQAAILSRLVKQVYSLEVIAELSVNARRQLKKMGYNNVTVKTGDGRLGWPEHAPFDGIIVTAATLHIPRPLIDQLRTGARLVIPVGLPYNYQELMVIEKKANGKIEPRSILGVNFVPLIDGCDAETTGKDSESGDLYYE
ncbi:MAG: protein-L-isoaspartate(D-aspartate) O-methyltransferase [Methylobacter sp.]|uniref:protein-L-isoaspartate(D-aspartate) O-methyltransferase n=1 Tax=Methylobacter sp. TaxID=2051955 RepID=UPI002730FEFB|nr:protein-L-isoaspartate(D-aspartate) O-methyltransferase [Methylobacter sp.]MDP1663752.1 protein-L-isoaspartate(D-aspartate) O-methyltransferase [Methylobacter sp.]MDP1971127.1 protein-L-isoaspartate(D-aspartate) O-methyltransferase [Methylobacter sp.]